VYYFAEKHFKNQMFSNTAIWDVCDLLKVPHWLLGLSASAKGWICGNFQLMNKRDGSFYFNGCNYDGKEGCIILSDWELPTILRSFTIHEMIDAWCIIVIEKEGLYHQLVQNGFWRDHRCILEP
jgi:DNA topoisomerase VI subunit A